jgi:hypothetical protein
MASNLSTIGFVFPDEETFRSSMVAFAGKAQAQLDAPCGSYGIWRSRTGAELWFHFGPSDEGNTEIYGLTPFFEGQSELDVRITGPIKRETDTPFEGAFYAWVNPDDADAGSYPLVFDAVDFAARSGETWPAVVRVKLSGFARELKVFQDEAAYRATDTGSGAPQLATEAFIPIGLFAAAEADAAQSGGAPTAPSSAALLTGRIVEASRMTNEATDKDFYWLLVESLDATFDLVADPEIVTGEVHAGSIVEATVWLFGRLSGPGPVSA